MSTGSSVYVNRNQQGNGVLKHLKKPWTMETPETCGGWDYCVPGASARILFISVKFHASKRGYLAARMAAPRVAGFDGLKVVLCLYDAVGEGMRAALEDINKRAFAAGFTCLVGWCNEDCAKHLEALRRRVPKRDHLKGKHQAGDNDAATPASVIHLAPKVSKPDANRLAAHFKTFARACRATTSDLMRVSGLGPTKVEMLRAAFAAPLVAPTAAAPPPSSQLPGAAVPSAVPAPPAPPAAVQPQQQQQLQQQPILRPVPFVPGGGSGVHPAAIPRPVPFHPPGAGANAGVSAPPVPFGSSGAGGAAGGSIASAAAPPLVPLPPVLGRPSPIAGPPPPPATAAHTTMLRAMQKRGRADSDDDAEDDVPVVVIKKRRTE